jgi:ankyrin repeat protein
MKYFRYTVYLIVLIAFPCVHAGSHVEFFRAVAVDNARTVSALLAEGFDPNTVSESGQVALYIAMRDDAPKVAQALLASPALKIDTANATGETPLMMAALKGRMDWTQRLIERGAKVQREGWTALHYAASGPNVKVLQLLLERGADIDAVAPNGNTALMLAARYGTEDSVRLLVQRGANKRLLNDRNLSAADLARSSERLWLVPLLQ